MITGIIKANLPTQIAFKVNRRIDSRVILDCNGAEKLLGFGDMLYMPPGGGALLRAQGTFVADDEMLAVVRYLEEHGQEPEFNPDLVQTQTSSRPSIADSDDRYREAVEIVLGQQRGDGVAGQGGDVARPVAPRVETLLGRVVETQPTRLRAHPQVAFVCGDQDRNVVVAERMRVFRVAQEHAKAVAIVTV